MRIRALCKKATDIDNHLGELVISSKVIDHLGQPLGSEHLETGSRGRRLTGVREREDEPLDTGPTAGDGYRQTTADGS